MYALQLSLPGTQVKLSLEGGGEVTLESVEANDWNNPDRGLLLQPDLFTQKAETWGQAVRYGGRETGESLTMVVAFLRKLTSGGISPRGLGGPITIAEVAGRSAYRGLPELLIFLTVLSANLAVLNFLPIPLLDGGHMVFLIYEGIRGKPADERVQLALTYVGLAFILTLMIFVFSLDLGLISRHVPIE
jgi:regulator of sigma E protease